MEVRKATPADKHSLQDLILHRVHEILLIASPYDAFVMEEDGGLTEQILQEYIGMNFSYAPRIWRADTAADAMEMIFKNSFDMVIVMMRISDMDPISIATQIKNIHPKIPIILLAFDDSELKQLSDHFQDSAIDQVFIWTGNANVFLAIVKQVEDRLNLKRDIEIGDVRCIIVIEDKPRYYSKILPLIYKEINHNIKRLMDKSLNDTERLLHMRARPKILLTTTYEEAQNYFKRYQKNTLGIVSDIRFPKKGKMDDKAGEKFVRWARSKDPSIPILLQSTHDINAELAKELHVNFIHKKSKTLLQDLRYFIVNNFGFGDFIFRKQDGTVVFEATDLDGLKEGLKNIPEESYKYHATSNHFSNWLAARGEFILASKIRPLVYEDSDASTSQRELVISLLDSAIEMKKESQVVEFASEDLETKSNFIRLCAGSLGGKARGLAFSNALIKENNLKKKFKNVKIRVPQAYVIGTGEFDQFMEDNDLWKQAMEAKTNKKINTLFLKAEFSEKLQNSLRALIKKIDYPLAIRSSSLLEDSQYQPLSGMYATYMLPNIHKDDNVRYNLLCNAIKRVYASTFYKEAAALIESSVHALEEEKMAVVIMKLVGQISENRFYPTFSGTAQSFNYYPVSYMHRNEGVAFVALGLGRTVAAGEKSLRFSPEYPAILPQYYSIKATLASSQNSFYALNLDKKTNDLLIGETTNLDLYDLSIAEKDSVLSWVGSVVSHEDNVIRDSLKQTGTRVITFAPVLKFGIFPLTEILKKLLTIGKRSFGCEIEIEFAVNLSKDKDTPHEFCLLQIKPMVLGVSDDLVQEIEHDPDNIICHSSLTLGNGKFNNIHNIVFVDPKNFDRSKSKIIAKEIEKITSEIGSKTPYMLIGPGRWGTEDPWLGIPIKWQQIHGAKIIVEVGMPKFPVDPSFGSHFFQNVTSMRLGYFTVNHKSKEDKLDTKWFSEQRVVKEEKYTKWIQTDDPFTVVIDGKTGKGNIVKPIPQEPEIMDEHEASLI